MKTKIDDFKEIKGTRHFTETNQHLSRTFNGVNYSRILTKLIQEAGRWCRNYASDLFVTWHTIYKQMEDRTLETQSHLFGFREYGVDPESFIFDQYRDPNASERYRAIWRLDITVEHIACPECDMVSLDLYEVQR